MVEQDTTDPATPDVRKSVTVAVPVAEAFTVFTEQPIAWLPPAHTFLRDPGSITMEPGPGGRFYERGTDGTEITRGTILEWDPPHRLVMTWRVGPNWQPLFSDEHASLIDVQFIAAGTGTTNVVLTHTHLHRHGDIAGTIRTAIDGPGPGQTLQRYADAVACHTT